MLASQFHNTNEFSGVFRVYIEDTDAGGIVYYANYLKFFERARTEWLREIGFEQSQLQLENILFVVKSLQVDYQASAKLDDLIEVTVEINKVSRVSIELQQNVFLLQQKDAQTVEQLLNSDSEQKKLLASATIKLACVAADTGKVAAIPSDVAAQLKYRT